MALLLAVTFGIQYSTFLTQNKIFNLYTEVSLIGD